MRKSWASVLIVFTLSLSLASAQLDGVLESEASGINVTVGSGSGTESQGIIGKTTKLLLTSSKLDSFLKANVNRFIDGKIPLIIQTDGRLSSSEREQLLELGSSVKYEYSIIDAVALSVDALQLDKLADLAFVERVELDAPVKIVLAQSTTQIGASRVWADYEISGSGVKVAVLDTGIDNEHPDLQNVVLERDFTGEGTDDKNGHGTHVASIVAGSGALSGGVNKGVAPGASLIDIKVLNGNGEGFMSDTIAGIQFAALNGAQVISMSLGSQLPCTGADASSLAADAAVKQGVHVVAAAGNLGPLRGTITSPGCAQDVVTVGAVDQLDNIAAFSSRGPTLDGRAKPDIAAPGVLIIAAQADGTYTPKSGTSMAAPHVSGVIALILSKRPGLNPSQVKAALMETAKDLGQDANSQGAGRVDAYSAFVRATGLEPVSDPGEDEARKKARDEEDVEPKKVRRRSSGDDDYYVVEGERKNAATNQTDTLWVWVNKRTNEIDKVEVVGFLYRIWSDLIDRLYQIEAFIRRTFYIVSTL